MVCRLATVGAVWLDLRHRDKHALYQVFQAFFDEWGVDDWGWLGQSRARRV